MLAATLGNIQPFMLGPHTVFGDVAGVLCQGWIPFIQKILEIIEQANLITPRKEDVESYVSLLFNYRPRHAQVIGIVGITGLVCKQRSSAHPLQTPQMNMQSCHSSD